MDETRRRFLWKGGGIAVLVLVCAIAFYAYQRPDMLVAFNELWAFCASLLR